MVYSIKHEHEAVVLGPGRLLQHLGKLCRQLGDRLAALGGLFPSQRIGDCGYCALEEMATGDAFYRVENGKSQLIVRRSAVARLARREALQQSPDDGALACRLRPVNDNVLARGGSRLRTRQFGPCICRDAWTRFTCMRVAKLRI